MQKHPIVLLGALMALLVIVACATTGEPPGGVPDWIILLLGAGLPWVYKTLMSKLPSIIRQPVAWVLSTGVAVGLGFAFLGWRSIGDILRNIPWLIIAMEFVYHTLVKPLARRAEHRKNSR